jgi:2-keto-4-pentenoate hydratase/2-oxohepta-3-ene-1,7-dioic acid hydratase in catechol pathway
VAYNRTILYDYRNINTMKLVSYEENGAVRLGALVGTQVLDLALASNGNPSVPPIPHLIEDFLKGGDALRRAAEAVISTFVKSGARDSAISKPLSSVKLLPPVPRPTKIICVARNYAEHAKEAGLELPTMPILFPRFANTLIANGADVVVPSVSHQLDWEGELAIVIGKNTKGRITREEAMDYVFGYTIFNDVTVRDYQFRVTQYTGGKNFRSSGPLGPVLVSADEIPDPHKLDITTTLNGEVMQHANTSTMIFDIPTILVHIADFIDLEAGDVIPTGTPAGVGFKRKPPHFLKAGDTISVTIPGIGTLSNPVVAERDQ